jgi:hypothetical protein
LCSRIIDVMKQNAIIVGNKEPGGETPNRVSPEWFLKKTC